jgi:hypothetical protein
MLKSGLLFFAFLRLCALLFQLFRRIDAQDGIYAATFRIKLKYLPSEAAPA